MLIELVSEQQLHNNYDNYNIQKDSKKLLPPYKIVKNKYRKNNHKKSRKREGENKIFSENSENVKNEERLFLLLRHHLYFVCHHLNRKWAKLNRHKINNVSLILHTHIEQ